MCGLLETMVVLWEGARDRLDLKKKGSKAARKKLVDRVSHSLPLLFDTFTVRLTGCTFNTCLHLRTSKIDSVCT